MRVVAFDIGETLIRDDRGWASWADWLEVPRHTLSGLVGAVVAQGRDNADALRLARPGLDVAAAHRQRAAEGWVEQLDESDLYPDVREAFTSLRAAGLRVIVAGNQTARAGELLRAMALPADAVATSGDWGVAKPHPDFFARLVDLAVAAPEEVVYVGDHPQNDIGPAARAGLATAHVRRGPYGLLWADSPEARAADWQVSSLTELVELLSDQEHRRGGAQR
ncbi:HAD family hydrolase [Streptomyces sp. NPDC059740]|uniref:HAD family hydrolase n=1 Tax=Streptomyces sp. NPDC059740 TaxID=3346926 RepID=UPI00366A30EF